MGRVLKVWENFERYSSRWFKSASGLSVEEFMNACSKTHSFLWEKLMTQIGSVETEQRAQVCVRACVCMHLHFRLRTHACQQQGGDVMGELEEYKIKICVVSVCV